MSETIAFIGLGVMGYPLAGHLAKAGHHVRVYNRTLAKAHAWAQEFGGSVTNSPAEAAAGATFVLASVGNEDVRQITIG